MPFCLDTTVSSDEGVVDFIIPTLGKKSTCIQLVPHEKVPLKGGWLAIVILHVVEVTER